MNQQNWLKDFAEFLNTESLSPPRAVAVKIHEHIALALNPTLGASLMVWRDGCSKDERVTA